MGGGLFALGAWPAGGVVPDLRQDQKDLVVVGAPPHTHPHTSVQQLAASALVVVYIFRDPLSGFG